MAQDEATKKRCAERGALSTADLLNAMEAVEKGMHEHIARQEQRISELSARLMKIEADREQQFQSELKRRLETTRPQLCYGSSEGAESISSRLMRGRL